MKTNLKITSRLAALPLTLAIALTVLAPATSRAQYHFYDVNVNAQGADCIRQEYRTVNAPGGIYDAIHEDDVTSSDGGTAYWYGGFTHQNSVNGQASTLVQYVCWPASGWFAPYCQQIPYFAGTNEIGYPQVGEGSSCAIKGYWPQFNTNLWYREVTRYWQNGTPHVGFQGEWIKEPVSGNWYHVGTVMYPFSVIGVDGMTGWQEDFSGYTGDYIVDHAGGYFHTNGVWASANQISYTSNGKTYITGTNLSPNLPDFDPVNPMTTESAVGPDFTSGYNNPQTWTLSNQPSQPAFDPIVVTNYSASVISTQLLVQWQLPLSSSPQLSYVVQVFNNSNYTGSAAVTLAANDPETRQAWLNISGVSTPYVSLTIADIFFNTNPPILITPSTPTPSPASSSSGTVGGLAFQYYEAASGNWTVLPNFTSLTPVYQGAVSFTDPTPRRKRINYGFNYTGYITVPTTGLYAFTLHSGDGSKLVIDGTTVINFDGLHDSSQFMGGGIALAAGAHTFNVQFFKGAANPVNTTAYTDGIGLAWQGPGIPYGDVPSSAYSRTPGASEPTVTLGTLVGGSTICSSNLALSATVSANGNTINKVVYYLTDYESYYFRPSQGVDYYLGSNSVSPYTLNVPIYAAPTNAVRARVFYNSTNILDSAVVFFASTNPPTATPAAPWQLVGNAPQNYPVGGSIQGGTYTLAGDNLSLMALQLKGNCTMVAHVASQPVQSGGAPDLVPDADGTWQAGIIMRSTTNTTPGTPLADGSSTREISLFNYGTGGTYYTCDLFPGGNGAPNNPQSTGGTYQWMKIQRVGNQFTNSVSANGSTWTTVFTTNLATVAADCYACLFIYQDPTANPNLNVATFDNVTITGNPVGPATVTVNPTVTNAYAGSTVTLTATAGGTQPYGYQWQYNGVNLAGATNATLSLTNVQPSASGDYTMVMTDGDNNTASATALVSVLFSSNSSLPQVTLTNPTNGAIFVAPATISLAASVTTNGYPINSVQFYDGATLVATAASAPYTGTWTGVPSGTYTLLAWVNYSGGASNSSPPIIVNVDPLPATPQNLLVTSPATNLISVSWAAAANATGYVLTRNGVPYATLSGTAYQDFGVADGTSYCYSVVATNSLGVSASSSTNCGSAALAGNALYWDAGSSPTGPQDGSDYWGYNATTWWNGSSDVDWTDNDVAVIGLAATTNCTITLTNSVTPGGIVFGAGNGGNYTVGNLTGVETITMPIGAAITTYGAATITAPVTTTGTFLAGGSGTLTLSGSGLTCTNALVSSGTLQVLKVSADCPYIVTNTGTLEIGYTTGGGYANTAMQIYGAGAAATTGFYLAGGQQYNTAGEITLLGAPTTIRQYGSGFAELSIFDINSVGLHCTAAASGSATDPNVEMINEGYGMTVQVDPGANTATGDLTINGPLSVGNLGFYKQGSGSLLLNGVATSANVAVRLQGGTVICGVTNCLGVGAAVPLSSSSTLNLNGFNQTVASITNPASCTLNFGGACTLTSTNAGLVGALQMYLNKGGTPNCSLLAVTGHPLTYGGALTVASLGTNAFASGDTFQLFSATSYNGAFSSISLPTLPNGLGWVTNLTISGSISVAVAGVPTVTISPAVATNYVGSTTIFTATATGGSPPYTFQWQFNGTNISGATSSNLTLVNLQLASSGLYTVVVPGTSGSGTATARLEVLSVPSGYAAQTLAYGPISYWRLDETNGSTITYDLMGNYNGTPASVTLGVAGVGNPSGAAGFESTNTAASLNGTSSDIQIPAMTGVGSTATLTVCGWINRASGNQASSAALFFERSGSTIRSGFGFPSTAGTTLSYTWNNTTVNSTLAPSSGAWAFVAWVMTTTNGKLYLGNIGSALTAFTNTASYTAQNFGATTPYLGYDSFASTRRFSGVMDEFAVYNTALNYQQITNLYAAGQATFTPPTVTLTNPADGAVFLTTTTTNINLGANVTANGHTITSVNFYSGTNLLGSVASAPYNYTWTASIGNYNDIYAQVVYENGAMNASLPQILIVNGIATAPTNVIATALATNMVGVTWSAGGSATGYIVSRSGTPIATVAAGATGYVDYTAAPNTSYCYTVQTTNLYSVSAASPSSCVTTPGAGSEPLVWNSNPASVSGPQDGGGNWGSGPVSWWNGSTNVTWTDGKAAVFGAGTSPGGTVTVTNTVSPSAITIVDGGYTLASSGTALLNPSLITAQANATISAALTNTAGFLTTAGPGTLTINGTGLEAVTTTVSSGTLQVQVKDGDSPYIVTNTGTLQIGYSTSGGYASDPMTIYGSGAAATTGLYLAGGTTYNVSGGVVVNGAPTTIRQYGSGLASFGIFDYNSNPGLSISAAASGSATDPNIQMVNEGYGMVVTTAAGANTATGDLTINGPLNVSSSNNGQLHKRGTGSLLLNGVAATGNNMLVIESGTVLCGITNCIGTNAVLSISSGGTLNLNGFSQTVAGTNSGGSFTTLGGHLVLTINNDGAPSSSNSVFTVRGTNTLTLGGTLTVTNLGTNMLVSGSAFTLLGNTNFAGSFSSITLPALHSGLGWVVTNLAVNGSISITGVVTSTSTPLFSPAAGGYVGAQSVTITSDAGATIFYTTDGSNPTTSGTRLSGASPLSGIIVPVNTLETIQAYATNSGTGASAVASATYGTIAIPAWVNAAGGSWPVTGNWSNTVVANGTGMTADISRLTLSTNETITLDSTPTVGQMIFADQGNAFGWTLASGTGGPLTLNAGTNTPSISVSNQTATISAVLAGANGLVKTGAGTLLLTNVNTYSGTTMVNAGQLVLGGNSGASGTFGGTLTVNPGAAVTATVGNALGYSGSEWVRTLNLYGGAFTTTANSDQGWGLTVNLMGGTLASSGTGSHFSAGGGWAVNTLATNSTSTISGSVVLRESNPNNQLVFTVASGGASPDLLVSGPISQNAAGYGIVKAGPGVMSLTGASTYTGATIVSNGTLLVNGSLTSGGAVTNYGGTLGGVGSIGSPVTVNSGGVLAPGTSAIGTLTISSALTLNAGSVTQMRLSKTGGTPASDLVTGLTSVTYGGALTVNNVTSDTNLLAAGDTFTLFVASGYAGTFSSVSLPGLSAGLYWNTNNLAVNGTISVGSLAYTLTYNAGAGGSISGTTPQTVNYGASGTAVTAVPNTGYSFVNWSDGSTANPRTDANVTNNLTVTANFVINTYTLTYTAGANGTISGTSPQTVNYGASGTAVTAVPNPGYSFVNWSDGSTANPRTDAGVTGNVNVTANFALNTYTLTYTAGTNGTVSGTSPQTVNYGASGSAVTAVPNAGYSFVNWSDGSTANPRTDANVTNNVSVTANFAINTYTLAYLAGTNGTLTGVTNQTVAYGTNGTPVTAVPDLGYSFAGWSDGSTNNPRTDLNVTSNITVTADFAISTFTLTYLAGTNGTLTGVTPQTVAYGTNGTPVTAVPNTGYSFGNWSDGSTANPRTDLDVTNSLTVTASFVLLVPPVVATNSIAFTAGSFTLGGTGGAGQLYILLTSSNLSSPVWMPVATNMADTNGVFQFTDPGATNGMQFYRIRTP